MPTYEQDRRLMRLPAGARYAAKVKATAYQNLIGYWPLSESSGPVISDGSGNGRNGTYTAVTLGAAGIGDGRSAATFNGTTGYGTVYSASLAGVFDGAEGTFAAWAQVSAAGVWTDATLRRVATFVNTAGTNVIIIYKTTTSNQLRLDYSGGGVSKNVLSTAMGGVTAWFHIAATWSKAADALKFYLNGAQVGTTQTGLGLWTGVLLAASGARLGASDSTPAGFWSGNLAHAGLWNTPLSAAQVASLAAL